MYLRHPSLNEDLHCYWEGVIISLTPSNVVCECPRSPSISVVSPLRWRQDHFVPLESCMRIPAMSSFDKNHLAIERESKMIFLCLQSLVCAYLEFLAHIYIIPPLRERHSFMQQSESLSKQVRFQSKMSCSMLSRERCTLPNCHARIKSSLLTYVSSYH